jgi:hypothetical protein
LSAAHIKEPIMQTLRFQLATFVLAITTAAPAWADTPLAARELGAGELGQLSGMPYLSPSNSTFEMAVAVRASAYNKGLPVLSVQRKTNATAAVYNSRPAHPAPLMPTPTAPGDQLNFNTTGDLTQSWATMTSNGVPYLRLTGFGSFEGDATASWNTTVTVPSGGSREVVVRVVVPPVSVAGNTEADGPARWRAKLRAELLVNGYPAWSTEAIRLTTNPGTGAKLLLQQFGAKLAFPTDDEDLPQSSGGLDNDTDDGNINSPAAKKVVHVTLGRFNPGAVLDLSMVMRGSALTVPAAAGGTDHRCNYSNVEDRYFCSRGSVGVDGSTGEAPRIYLLP